MGLFEATAQPMTTMLSVLFPWLREDGAVAAKETCQEATGRIPAHCANLVFDNTVLSPASLKILLCQSGHTTTDKSGHKAHRWLLPDVFKVRSMSDS